MKNVSLGLRRLMCGLVAVWVMGCSDNGSLVLPTTTPTATVGSPSVVYGTASTTLTAVIAFSGGTVPTGGVTVTVNGSAAGVGTVTCTGAATPVTCSASYASGALAVGTYSISATLARDSKYNATTATGTLIVTQATPVLTATAVSVSAGAASVTLAATLGWSGAAAPSGAVTFTVNNSATGVGAVSCTGTSSPKSCTASYASGTATVGSLPVQVSVAGDTNYVATSAVSTLTVTVPVPVLTVTAGTISVGAATSTLTAKVAYSGSAVPTGAVSFTASGSATGVGAVTCLGTTSPRTCVASLQTGSLGAGTYPVTATEAADANYASASGAGTLTVTVPPVLGNVQSGTTAVVGAHVYLMGVSTAGYAGAATSLMTAAATGASDSVGAYVVTDAQGKFTVPATTTCTTGQPMYYYVAGGTIGANTNAAIGLLSAAGVCVGGAVPAGTTFVNEVTTVAMAYGLAGFASDATHLGSSGTALARTNIVNAFGNVPNLASLTSGNAVVIPLLGYGTAPYQQVNLLADILAACTASSGPNSAGCSTLFNTATSTGTVAGTKPTDTATAAINIAHNPASNVAALEAIGLVSPSYATSYTAASAPKDFTLAINWAGIAGNLPYNGLAGQIAFDAGGNLWMLNSVGVVKFGPNMQAGSGFAGYLANASFNMQALAIDPSNNVWLSYFDFTPGAPTVPGGGSIPFAITQVNASGVETGVKIFPLNQANFGSPLMLDASLNLWMYYYSMIEFSKTGALISPANGWSLNLTGSAQATGGQFPAFDANGTMWGDTYFINGERRGGSSR